MSGRDVIRRGGLRPSHWASISTEALLGELRRRYPTQTFMRLDGPREAQVQLCTLLREEARWQGAGVKVAVLLRAGAAATVEAAVPPHWRYRRSEGGIVLWEVGTGRPRAAQVAR